MRADAAILIDQLPRLPLYLVWLVGVILALVRRRRHPRASLFTVVAIAIFCVNAVLGFLANLLIQQVVRTANMPWVNGLPVGTQVALISQGRTVVELLLATVGFGLLIAAALVLRRPAGAPASVPPVQG